MIHLKRITARNVWDILKLRVAPSQAFFVADNATSIIEAYTTIAANGHVFPFGIYDGSTPVGFLMIGFGTDDEWENPPCIAQGNYNIWRLMIDSRYQGKGYGRAALKLALEFIASRPCGKAEYCWLSYEPENEVAKSLYQAFGFIPTGDKDGGEEIAVLKL